MRGGSGLGDTLYLRPIVEQLLAQGEQVIVCTNYPEVFAGLDVRTEIFGRNRIDILAHYAVHKQNPGTNQWQDICRSAGIDVPLRFEWRTMNIALINKIMDMASGRPIVLVHGGRAPMARSDGFGIELMPERKAFETVLDALDGCFLVKVGNGTELYPLRADLDLSGKTSVTDLIDLGAISDGMVAQCSFVVPLAEGFDKPLLAVWAASGLHAQRHPYINSITPQKILSKPGSTFVIDNWTDEELEAAARVFVQIVSR